jgi:hypothetical protein
MAARPPKRPRPVDSIGTLAVDEGDPQAPSRAFDAITDALNRMRQQAAAPTVNRVTLNDSRPLTNIAGSFYTDGADLFWLDFDGNRIQITDNGAVNAPAPSGGTSVPYSSYWYAPTWTAGNVLDTRGPTNDQCRALYMGRAPQALSSIKVAWRQTAAAATITYAEMGIATGTLVPGSTPSLVIRGYVDASAQWLAGAATNVLTVPVTGADIAAGEDIWAVYAVNFTGTPTIAVSNVSDRLDMGAICTRAACRLSTNLNTAPLAFVLDAGATPAWIAFAL